MNWEEWDKAYPVPEVYEEPQYIIETFSNRMDAEQYKENLELAEDRGGFEIVLYKNVYFLILEELI